MIYHFDTDKRTGQIVLAMEKPCGSRPVIGWRGLEAMKGFANMLLDFYWQERMKKLHIDDVSYNLLLQALDEE
jgi:hypothetical protein